ncbi:MAG: hypothetical protein KAI71_02650 [Candidatus Pacebacteria bacterium]|nr:hypothetical protein [Candidatus Paceibacterota bacterium]
MISEEQLKKYKDIYRKKFGKEISDQEALEQGTKLISLMEIIYKPITKNKFKAVQKRRRETGDI